MKEWATFLFIFYGLLITDVNKITPFYIIVIAIICALLSYLSILLFVFVANIIKELLKNLGGRKRRSKESNGSKRKNAE